MWSTETSTPTLIKISISISPVINAQNVGFALINAKTWYVDQANPYNSQAFRIVYCENQHLNYISYAFNKFYFKGNCVNSLFIKLRPFSQNTTKKKIYNMYKRGTLYASKRLPLSKNSHTLSMHKHTQGKRAREYK